MILYIDTETTGFPNMSAPSHAEGQPYVASIGAFLIGASNEPEEVLDVKIKPEGWTMPRDLVDKLGNGLYQEVLERDGIELSEAMQWLDDMHGWAHLIVGANPAFDMKMLSVSKYRCESRTSWPGDTKVFDVLSACAKYAKITPTPAMLRAGFHWNKTPKLSEAVKLILGRDHDGAHSAMADALAARDLHDWLLGAKQRKAAERREGRLL